MIGRRQWIAASGAAALGALAGCRVSGPPQVEGAFSNDDMARGHALRGARASAVPDVQKRTRVVIAGGGIAGLAAARALGQSGMPDFALLELADQPGGNSRSGRLGGLAHPLGAHYLPLPGDDAHEVQDLLEELGLRQRPAGRWRYDERHLCHSPQERLFFHGAWQDGLLPLQDVGEGTIAQYRRFAQEVRALRGQLRFAIPAFRAEASPLRLQLDAQPFGDWLGTRGLDDAHLRWYLDYCCRDEYGAGVLHLSAWAGLHYFASRHGFHAPGDEAGDAEPVLTWPEGNAWLSERMASPLADRLHTGQVVLRVAQGRHGVEVDVLDVAHGRTVRWQAERCILALPIFIAARVVEQPPPVLMRAASMQRHAPWLVANLQLDQPLLDAGGAAPSWDNVVYASGGLGYVDARHQSLDPTPGPTVLSAYYALGPVRAGEHESRARQQMAAQPWTHWRDRVFADLAEAHPDLPERTRRVSVTRWGHAMAMPTPGWLAAMGALPEVVDGRLAYAHSDWSGYSIFEEAFTRGHLAGLRAARAG